MPSPKTPLLAAVVVLSLLATAATSVGQEVRGPSGGRNAGVPDQKPEAAGAETGASTLPRWLQVAFLYRGRVEAVRPVSGSETANDGYYLNRLRLSASIVGGRWLQATAQVQDAEALGYAATPAPRSMAGGFDLRQGYVELGYRGRRGLTALGGRSEYTLGDGRLIASSDWGNTSRTFDLGRVSGWLPGVKVDVFRLATVDVDPHRFDRAKPGEHVWGIYGTATRLRPLRVLDVYMLEKVSSVVIDERGGKGDGRIRTWGTRAAAPLGAVFAIEGEAAVQRGHAAHDDVAAWAAHAGLSWAPAGAAWQPRLALEYSLASGDRSRGDGTQGTFDQLYASNHAKFGIADLVAFRNLRALVSRIEALPTTKIRLNAAIANLRLASVADAWYASSGSKLVLNSKATSSDLGWESAVYGAYTVSRRVAVGAGVGLLKAGRYLRQSTTLGRYWYPYVTWTAKF